MDPTLRFSNRAENYRRYRPGYPAAVVNLIRKTCEACDGARIADIGSGTGIFTRCLLEAGFDVSAVEPNEPMREVAEADLKEFPRFHSVAAPAEDTGLSEHHFSALTVAQAFHWFDREPVRREFSRILRADGWAFIIWNERQAKLSAFNHEYQALLASLGQTFEGIRDRVAGDKANLESFFVPGSYQMIHFDNPHVMDWEQLRGRFLSSSYVPAEDDPRHPALVAKLEEIFRSHEKDGQVEFEQRTGVYFGRL